MSTPRTRTRPREASARPTTVPSTASNPPRPRSTQITLPSYEPLEYPLGVNGQSSLATAVRDYPASRLGKLVKETSTALADNAGHLNEYLRDRECALSKRKAKLARIRAQQSHDEAEDATFQDAEDEELEREAEKIKDLSDQVDKITKRMENKVMKMVDNEAEIHALQTSIKEVQRLNDETVTVESNGTQPVPSTHRTNAFQSTAPATASTSLTTTTVDNDALSTSETQPRSLYNSFNSLLEQRTDDFHAQTLSLRYAEHPLFVGFKQAVHEYRHGEDGPPLEDASRWFADSDARPGETAAGDDGEGDLTISREKLSTKCPLTQREFETPVTCKKCKHSYEKRAIEEFLKQQRPPTAGAGRRQENWVRQVQCPVPGCDTSVEKTDLEVDHVLVQRIKRAQRARERRELQDKEDEDNDDSDHPRNAANRIDDIESDSDSGRPGLLTQIKQEKKRLTDAKQARSKRRRNEEIEDD